MILEHWTSLDFGFLFNFLKLCAPQIFLISEIIVEGNSI